MFIIVRATYSLMTRQDMVIQSPSSKLVKQLLMRSAGDLAPIREMFGKDGALRGLPDKPIKLSMVRSPSGRYLWSDGSRPIILKADTEYSFAITYVDMPMSRKMGLEPPDVVEVLARLEGGFTVYTSFRVLVKPLEVKVVTSEQLGNLGNPDYVKITFETPTLLQYPKHPKLNIRESVHTLYPQPLLLTLNLLRKWNQVERVERIGLSHAIYAPYELREVNHNIKPTTIQVGRVRERGFTGWIMYKLTTRSEERLKNYLRLLELARYVGVGRSTTLGLGTINITPITNQNTTKPKQRHLSQ